MIYIVILLLFAADQATKFLTTMNLGEYDTYVVIDGILNFTRSHNTGGPWSIFSDFVPVFIAATFLIFIIEIIYFKKHPLKRNLSKISVILINSGALGNLADRIFRGYVVDMIELKFINYPIFNLADCFVVIGCILMCIDVIFFEKENINKEKEK